jgi:hypothetical protein
VRTYGQYCPIARTLPYPAAFVKWHAGQLTWAEALRDSRIRLDGPSWLIRAFPTWNARSTFAHIKPVPGAASAN